MKNSLQQSLIPLKQAIILFHGYELLALLLPDNRIAVTLNSLCAMLGIQRDGQVRRIRRNKDVTQHLLLALVETAGGPQRMDVLVAEAIPFWVLGVQIEQLAPEKRQLVITIQMEIVAVLYRHFFGEEGAVPQPEPPETLPGSPFQMIHSALQTIGEAVQMLEAHQQITDAHMTTIATQQTALQETQQTMGGRLTGLEDWHEVAEERQRAMGDYLVETRERVTALEQWMRAAPGDRMESEAPSGNRLLSPQHLGHVYVLAREERRRSGIPVSEQLAALAGAFEVPDVSDLPDALWDDVLAWFWERRQRG
jgi:hypothetical protein